MNGVNYEIIYDIGNSNGYLQVFVYHKLSGENEITKLAYIKNSPFMTFATTPVLNQGAFKDLPYIIDFDQ